MQPKINKKNKFKKKRTTTKNQLSRELQGEIEKVIITDRDFNTFLSIIEQIDRKS